MRMELKSIEREDAHLSRVRQLYQEAFPKVERVPFERLFTLKEKAAVDFIGYYHEAELLGFTYTFHYQDLSWLFYFAVVPSLRGKGIGTSILQQLEEREAGKRLMIDIEDPDQPSENEVQRRKRYDFYLRMGFSDYGIRKHWAPITYNILAYGGAITVQDYDNLVQELWRLLDR